MTRLAVGLNRRLTMRHLILLQQREPSAAVASPHHDLQPDVVGEGEGGGFPMSSPREWASVTRVQNVPRVRRLHPAGRKGYINNLKLDLQT